jgi:hypothetical protein
MTLEAIIEKGDVELSGWINIPGQTLLTTVGKTVKEVLANLRFLLADFIIHEGQESKKWKKVDITSVEFDIKYDLQAFFGEHSYLNISEVAKRAGMNTSLLRGYASGSKHASPEQTKKIEETLHRLASELQEVSLYA